MLANSQITIYCTVSPSKQLPMDSEVSQVPPTKRPGCICNPQGTEHNQKEIDPF